MKAYVIRYERTEAMKQLRREIGDNGGIRFQGKKTALRLDGLSNTITSVLKDNILVEIYENNEPPKKGAE